MSANTEILVSADWLKENLSNPAVRILDARTPREYAAGHIPNAVLVGYEHFARVDDSTPYLEVLPKEEAEEAFGSLGIDNDTTVVVYGDRGGITAARVFWTLEYYGGKARLLEVGFYRWLKEGYPVTRDAPRIPRARFEASVNEHLRVDAGALLKKLEDPDLIVLDTRSPEEYAGIVVQTRRVARIPGSINLPWDNCVGRNGELFDQPDALRKVFEERGITKDKEIVTYCMVGERAAHTYVALRILGYPHAKLYEKSFSEWGNSDDLPVE